MIFNNKFQSIELESEFNVTNLITLFHYKYPRNYEFKGEVHDFWEFIYVDQGILEITADDRKYLLKSGEIIFHHPNQFHAVRTFDSKPASAIICSFSCDHSSMNYFKNYTATLNFKEREYLNELIYLRSRLFFNDSIPFNSTPKPTNKIPFYHIQTVKSYLELLLLKILTKIGYQDVSSELNCENNDNSYHNITQTVIMYLKENIDKKLTLSQLSSVVGYSIPRMKRVFHNDMKQGIIDYFVKLKIDEAKRMIIQNDYNLSQISSLLNFNDCAYFSRKFKQYEGVTPSEFKRLCMVQSYDQ